MPSCPHPPPPSTYDDNDGTLVSPSPTSYVPPLAAMMASHSRRLHPLHRVCERERRGRRAIHVRMSASIAPYAYSPYICSPGEQHSCSPPYQYMRTQMRVLSMLIHTHVVVGSRYYNNEFTFQKGPNHLEMVGRWSGDGPKRGKCALEASCNAPKSCQTNKETDRK